MTQTPAADRGVTLPPPEQDTGSTLPPYSGEQTTCIKCSNCEAHTSFEPAMPHRLTDFNGTIAMRGPLPERLERTCRRCGYAWDEALAPSPPSPPASVEDVAYALRLVAPPWFGNGSLLAATRLNELFDMRIRVEEWTTDHGLWILRDHGDPTSRPDSPSTDAAGDDR